MLQLKSPAKELCVDLDKVRLNIGRDRNNDLVLEDSSVSGFHATLFVENDIVELVDVGSSNGTFVNGRPIAGRQRLKAWDKVRFGGCEMELVDPAGRPQTTIQPAVGLSRDHADAASAAPAATGPLLATLRAVTPGGGPASFEVHNSLSIGRSPANTLTLDQATVSSKHAEIIVSGERLELVDLGSTNGTWVNGQRISRQVINNGDRIRFDEIEYSVALPQTAAARTAVNPAAAFAPGATMVNPAVTSTPAPAARPAEPVALKSESYDGAAITPAGGDKQSPVVPAPVVPPVMPPPVARPQAEAQPQPPAQGVNTVVGKSVAPPPPMAPPKVPVDDEGISFAMETTDMNGQQGLKWLLFSLQGRVGRGKYFLAGLLLTVVGTLFSSLLQLMFLGEVAIFDPYSYKYGEGQLIHFAASLILCGWPGLALGVKRFHDQNRSGQWLWLAVVPLLNLIAGIMLLFVPGTKGENRFGSSPASAPSKS